MTLHRFIWDKLYRQHLTENTPAPFAIKAFDFTLPNVTSAERLGEMTRRLLEVFDVFRVRMHFIPDQGVFAVLGESGAPDVRLLDVDRLERDVPAQGEFCARHGAEIDLLRGPPAVFYAYRAPSRNRSMLRILCTHFSFDFITYRVIEQALRRLAAGETVSVKNGSYLRWMDVYGDYAAGAAGRAEWEYWARLPLRPFETARSRLPVSKNGPAVKISCKISLPGLLALRASCRLHGGCRLVDAIAGSVLRAIGRGLDLDVVPVNWTAHGRFPVGGHTFANTAGWLSNRHPLLVPVVANNPFMVARALRDAVQQIPSWGSTYAWVIRFCVEAERAGLETLLHAPITVNVREGAALPPVGALTGVPATPAVTRQAIAQWLSASSLYVVIDVGLTADVSITCVDEEGLPDKVERMMREAATELCRGGLIEAAGGGPERHRVA